MAHFLAINDNQAVNVKEIAEVIIDSTEQRLFLTLKGGSSSSYDIPEAITVQHFIKMIEAIDNWPGNGSVSWDRASTEALRFR